MFMILYYKPLLLEFIHKLFQKNNPETVDDFFAETKAMIQQYLIGLLLQFTIVATLYSTGLLILGVQYAILLGVIGAMLNVVPYIGPWIAAILFMIMATVTDSSSFSHVFLVLLMFVIVHFADNTFIVPKIVASKVRLNALATLVAVFTGHAIWGIPGMFLSIPIVAIVKLIFDRIVPLKPWGFLLGDMMPTDKKWNFRRKRVAHHK
jgi:predicted PurR-regulated permease PerM